MRERLIELVKELIQINSVSNKENLGIIDIFKEELKNANFNIEILNYTDPKGIIKYNLVARKGDGVGGLAFLIHSDTVPLASEEQLIPVIKNNRLYGRGACDMKGPAAAGLLAVLNSEDLKYPITFIITTDEEIGCEGAGFVAKESKLLKEFPPYFAITTEPTELKTVYAHKGLCDMTITATGLAAHSSTGIGDSANFKMIPFLYFISQIKEKYKSDTTYQNQEFTPPDNTLNLTISDFNCAPNVTAAKSSCKICFRTMPHSRTQEVVDEIIEEANRLGLDSSYRLLNSIHTDSGEFFIQLVSEVTGKKPETVAYLTDASMFSEILKPIILGPGSIKQAHTKDEYIDIDELVEGYEVYKNILTKLNRDTKWNYR